MKNLIFAVAVFSFQLLAFNSFAAENKPNGFELYLGKDNFGMIKLYGSDAKRIYNLLKTPQKRKR